MGAVGERGLEEAGLLKLPGSSSPKVVGFECKGQEVQKCTLLIITASNGY